MLGWLGLAVIGVVNGGLRQGLYSPWLTERFAHQQSTVTFLAVSAGYVWWLQRHWPLPSSRTATRIGAAWVVLTLLFELGLGHYLVHESWSALLADYDLAEGRIWILAPLWVSLAPTVVRRLATTSGDRRR